MLDPLIYFIDTNETKASGTYVLHLHKYYDAIIYYTKLANWPSLLGIVNQEVYLDEQYEEREEEVDEEVEQEEMEIGLEALAGKYGLQTIKDALSRMSEKE